MRNVLIVSPHFPPTNAPDMQRVRLALPHLRDHGWEPTVLALAPVSVEAVQDPLLEQTYPPDTRVVRVRGIPPATTRRLGFGHVWWRCGRALAVAGEQLLRDGRFDLVFFSTTQFEAFTLAPRWRARFGTPYVLDYQDPWVNDYYERTGTRPPGGRLKFALSQWVAKRSEPRVVRDASGIITVSDAYLQTLARRYPAGAWKANSRVVPFGAAATDFAIAASHRPAKPLIDFEDGFCQHVYVGRCGPDMRDALTILFRALRTFQRTHPADAACLRFDFIGTGYAPPPLGDDTVLPIAQAEGVADLVREHRYRVPYFDALWYLHRAHALVAIGSNDPGYSPSKIFPYVLARRPLAAILHGRSPALRVVRELSAGVRFGFGHDVEGDIEAVAAEVHQRWFVEQGYRHALRFDESAFQPYTAEAMTTQLAAVFDAAAAGRAASDAEH